MPLHKYFFRVGATSSYDNFSCASNTTSSYVIYTYIYIYVILDTTSQIWQKQSLTRQKDVKNMSEVLERSSKTIS